MSPYDAVLFIGFGGPEKREDIRPFLERVTQGRGIPPERIEEVAHHYEKIGGASPINAITQRQANGLRAALAKTDTPWSVYVGNRNWHPFLEDTLRRMAADGVKRAIGILTAVAQARENVGIAAPTIVYVGPWFDHPLFIEAICDRIKSVIPRGQWRGI